MLSSFFPLTFYRHSPASLQPSTLSVTQRQTLGREENLSSINKDGKNQRQTHDLRASCLGLSRISLAHRQGESAVPEAKHQRLRKPGRLLHGGGNSTGQGGASQWHSAQLTLLKSCLLIYRGWMTPVHVSRAVRKGLVMHVKAINTCQGHAKMQCQASLPVSSSLGFTGGRAQIVSW